MKSATRNIIEYLPSVENNLKDKVSTKKPTDSLDTVDLDHVIDTFTKLAKFFESPEKEVFNLQDIYNNLDDSWLRLALDSISLFFEEDTYLIKDSEPIIMKEEDYLSQKEFANYLNENGQKFSEAKMSVYVQRNVIPEPDLMVINRRYWKKETCKDFLISLKNKEFIYKKINLHLIENKLNNKNTLLLGNGGSGKTNLLHDIILMQPCPTIFIGDKNSFDVIVKNNVYVKPFDLTNYMMKKTIGGESLYSQSLDFVFKEHEFVFINKNILDNLLTGEFNLLNELLLELSSLEKNEYKKNKFRFIFDDYIIDEFNQRFFELQETLPLKSIFSVQSISEHSLALLPFVDNVVTFKNTDKRSIDFVKDFANTDSSVFVDPSVLNLGEFIIL